MTAAPHILAYYLIQLPAAHHFNPFGGSFTTVSQKSSTDFTTLMN
jgi:hypothetical protein